jgi:gas vesicle protein
MCEIVSGVILGGIVGGGASKLPWRRPLRFAMREGIRAQRKLAQVVERVQAEAKQLVAEAREELDHPPGSSSNSKL